MNVIAQSTYSNFDDFGRPGRVTYLDGSYEDTQYACCGIDSTTDRDGVTTTYLRDAAKRQIGQSRLGILATNLLSPAGQVLKSLRVGTDNSVIVLNQAQYDVAGGLVNETNALSGVTSYSETTDSGTGERTRTTTYPDGGTRIEVYNRDGTLKR